MAVWGPYFAHLFGVDEADVLASWTVERWTRYRRAAEFLMKQRQRGG